MKNRVDKLPIILQDEPFECGLACMASIAQAYGISISLDRLRKEYEVSADGLSFYHLIKVASDLGLSAKGYYVDAEDLADLRLPAIILWNNCHFVVLTKVERNYIEVMDPAVGSRRFDKLDVASFFGGAAMEVTSILERPKTSVKPYAVDDDGKVEGDDYNAFDFGLLRFFKTFGCYWTWLVPLLILSICVQLAQVASPKFISLTLDEVLGKHDKDFLHLLLFVFGFVYLIQTVCGYIKNLLVQRLRQYISQEQGEIMIFSLMRMPIKYFWKRHPSDIIRRAKAIDQVHYMYTHGWMELFFSVFFSSVFAFLMYLIDPKLTVIVLVLSLAFVLLRVVFVPAFKSRMYSAIDGEIRRDFHLMESIKKIEAVKLYQLSDQAALSWNSEHARLEQDRARIERMQANVELTNQAVSHLQMLVIVGLGASAVLKGENSVGMLVSFIFYKDFFMGNVLSAVENHLQIKMVKVETDRLKDVRVSTENRVQGCYRERLSTPYELLREVAFDSVSFSYSNLDGSILHDISIILLCDEKVALLGPSGCGKTTFMNILSGLLEPTSGKVLINGRERGLFGQNQYSKQVAVVRSSDKVIPGTVIDNVIYGEVLDVDLLECCLSSADLDDVIRQLPLGLNTRLGPNGSQLSSGQQQRLMIARALYRQPKLLMLDEPTSHLDGEARRKVMETIERLDVGVFLITHDEEVAAICHRILRIKEGKLIESGVDS